MSCVHRRSCSQSPCAHRHSCMRQPCALRPSSSLTLAIALELSARLQRAVHVARVEQQEQHTGLALPSCHRSQAARQGRRPISVHASAATIEYVDALCYILRSCIPPISSISYYIRYIPISELYNRMLACREGAVARVERHLVWHCKRYEAARQRHPSLSTSATVIEYVDALPVA